MKKALFFSAFILLLGSLQTAFAQPSGVVKTKGTLSPHSENEDSETDPPFTEMPLAAVFLKKKSKSDNNQHVSEIENGMKIVKDIIDKLISREYSFSLLSQHKYMVNSCLGVKVSAGQFSLKFANPVIEIGTMGKITVKLKVNKIKFSAFKVRTKPCTKPLHALDPCHFGGKFEIGGEATDLSVKATLDLIVPGLQGSAGLCYFAFGDAVEVTWKIGGFNLRPMPNILDNVGKEMVEDALNRGMGNLYVTKFIELSREVIPQYYTACEQVYTDKEIMKTIYSEAATSNDSTGNTIHSEKWENTSVPAMKGSFGRLKTNFPADVEWRIDIRTTGNKFITNRSKADKQTYFELEPGVYNLRLNTVTIENVRIEQGTETRLRTGVLKILSQGHWDLYDNSGKIFYTSGNKPVKLALPVGNYQLKRGGQFISVNIQDDAMVEM